MGEEKKEKYCLICGKLSPMTICEACALKIQGEAADKKRKVEKKGKVDTGRS